jgi:hypothetical protein
MDQNHFCFEMSKLTLFCFEPNLGEGSIPNEKTSKESLEGSSVSIASTDAPVNLLLGVAQENMLTQYSIRITC